MLLTLGHREYFNWVSDKSYLKIAFWARMHKKLDLEHPKSFSEKLQWLKLYDRNPRYTQLCDKYEVKAIVGDIIGHEYLIPTLGVWEKFEDIDFSKLPERFVLKCTHDSGGVIVCKDKSKLNYKKSIAKSTLACGIIFLGNARMAIQRHKTPDHCRAIYGRQCFRRAA